MNKFHSWLIYLTVFLTGLFSLVYQTVWQRYLTFLVGADSKSSVLTLTVFLTALSIGYYLSGKFSSKIKEKELFYYGVVEFIIGLWGLIFPWLFKFSFTLVQSGLAVGLIGDIILSIVLTAIPAVMMGTTLPFLTQGLSRTFNSSSKTHANVYAVNTIGACIGALLTGFWLIEYMGLASSMYVVGFVNMLFGLVMIFFNNHYVLYKDKASSTQIYESVSHIKIHTNKYAILVVAACSGYLLIAIESYFIRLFSVATDGSIYAYPTVITAFIAAVGIGAALSSKLMQKSKKLFVYIPPIVLILWIAVYYSIPQWPYADYILKYKTINWFGSYDFLPIIRFVALFIIIGLPVIISSMLLPFLFHFYKNQFNSIGKTTGNLYAVATVATIFGGLIGGYFLFSYLDFKQVFLSHFIVMAIMSLSAVWVLRSKLKLYLQTLSVLMAAFLLLFIFPNNNFSKNLALSFYFQTPTSNEVPLENATDARMWLWQWFDYEEILASSIRAEGSVSVFNKNLNNNEVSRMIAINGRSNSGTRGVDYQGNALLSLFPYLLTESPKRILIIGLGTGVTAGAIANQNLVEKVNILEINAAVTEQLHYFDFATFNASKNPKINIYQADAVKYLLRTKNKYDVIVSIPSNFWTAGMENLMTPDFYTIAKNKLAEGGTYIQWIPDYDFSQKGLATIIKSFISTFDDSSLWRLTSSDLMLMYSKEIDKSLYWISDRLNEKTFQDSLSAIKYDNPMDLMLGHLADAELLKKLSNDGKDHSIDKPTLGSLALEALYNPESEYSVEKVIESIVQ